MSLKRVASILPSLPFVGWFTLMWTVLAHASTGQFAFGVFGSMSQWLGRNAWAGFVVGLAFLALAVAWPELGPWLSNKGLLSIPKTLGQRLSAIEVEHIPRIAELESIPGRLQFLESITKQGVATPDMVSSTLETAFKEMTAGEGRCVQRVIDAQKTASEYVVKFSTALQKAITALQERTDGVEVYAKSILMAHNRLESSVSRHAIALLDIHEYYWDALRLAETFRSFRERYGNLSPVVIQTFHPEWRLPSHSIDPPSDDSIRDGEKWAHSLECHVRDLQGLCMRLQIEFFTGELYIYITTWRVNRRDMNSDSVSRLLDEHAERLRNLRESYAAKLAGVSESAAIS